MITIIDFIGIMDNSRLAKSTSSDTPCGVSLLVNDLFLGERNEGYGLYEQTVLIDFVQKCITGSLSLKPRLLYKTWAFLLSSLTSRVILQ